MYELQVISLLQSNNEPILSAQFNDVNEVYIKQKKGENGMKIESIGVTKHPNWIAIKHMITSIFEGYTYARGEAAINKLSSNTYYTILIQHTEGAEGQKTVIDPALFHHHQKSQQSNENELPFSEPEGIFSHGEHARSLNLFDIEGDNIDKDDK